MKKIDIFYIATGVYLSYFDNFIATIKYFFPESEKYVHVITDTNLATTYDIPNVHIDINVIINLPYPLVALLKTTYIKHFMTDDMEYVFYFDADTIFLNKDKVYWDNLKENIEQGNIIMPLHPIHDHTPHYIVDNNTSEAYLPIENFKAAIISSFYGGKASEVKKLIDMVNYMVKRDLNREENDVYYHYIPAFFDEDYINKIVNTRKDISFTLKHFVGIFYTFRWNNTMSPFDDDLYIDDWPDEICVKQKYDIARKYETKNL